MIAFLKEQDMLVQLFQSTSHIMRHDLELM